MFQQGLTVFEPLLRKENATEVGKRAPCAQISRWTANPISDQEKAQICSVKKDALTTKMVELQQKSGKEKAGACLLRRGQAACRDFLFTGEFKQELSSLGVRKEFIRVVVKKRMIP